MFLTKKLLSTAVEACSVLRFCFEEACFKVLEFLRFRVAGVGPIANELVGYCSCVI